MKQIILSIAIAVTGITTAQNVNIPDANFKDYLLANTAINTNGDNEISVAEAEAFTGEIDCSGLNIHDLTGIEAFVNLQWLVCYENQLTSLDITQNVNLRGLYCGGNQLTSLDVSQNVNLSDLVCYENQLTFLDVSKNVDLWYLDCDYNQLTSLDVSQNVNLETLYFYNNQLTFLDVSKNVDLWSLDCGYNQLTSLDITQNVNLSSLLCDANQLTSLDVSQNVNLNTLSCNDNPLSSLDVSQNVNLNYLDCANNNLSSLDVSQNTALEYLECSENSLITLDLNGFSSLFFLYCDDNQLIALNLKGTSLANGGWFTATENPDLNCIEVDSLADISPYWFDQVDNPSAFSEDCYTQATFSVNDVVSPVNFTLFPNPFNDFVSIRSNQNPIENVKIYDIKGSLLYESQNQANEVNLNLSNFNTGIYFVKITSQNGEITKKLVKR